MKLSDFVIKYLEDYGIKNIYSVTGGMCMHLTDSISRSNIKLISTMHEQGAGIAAEGDCIYNNNLAVLLTTAGPGILNAINPITSAWIDGNPLLIISGQCKTADMKFNTGLRQKGVQEVDAVSLLKNITKYSTTILDANDIKRELAKAIHEATTGRKGPVFLEIPLDIQVKQINDSMELYNFNTTCLPLVYLSLLDNLMDLINQSKKPVIMVGNGVRSSGGLNIFKSLINKLKIPILLTWKSKDFLDDSNIYNFGMPGSISTYYANYVLQNCDLLICIGTRLDLPTVAYDYTNFAKKAIKVIIDIDQAEIEKLNFNLNFNIDAKDFLSFLYGNSKSITVDTSEWLTECINYKNKYPHIPLVESCDIDPYEFIRKLSIWCNSTDIIVASSSGSASEITCQSFNIKEGQRFICSNGLGSMGYAISHSIGVVVASGRKVICIEGDGSFQMNLSELELIRRYNLPIKIFILNNGGYNSIRNTQNKFLNGNLVACNEQSGLSFPNVKKIAELYELQYIKINKECILDTNIHAALYNNDATIIEVIIDSNVQTQPKVQNSMNSNGKIILGTLENLWPFINN